MTHQLSVPVRLCDAPYLLAPGKRGLPPTFPWHLFSPPPHALAVGRKLGLFFLLDSAFIRSKSQYAND